MGQYYHQIILGENRKSIKAFFYAHKYGNGLKLMEHSYVNNNLVNAVVNYLLDHNGGRLVWAGDYADNETVTLPVAETLPIWQKEVAEGRTTLSHTAFRKTSPLCQKESEETLYSRCNGDGVLDYDDSERDAVYAFVNRDKKELFILWDCVVDVNGYRVHPLPLLTAEGNGRGGGDYWGSNQRFVGTWARDFIEPIRWNERGRIDALLNEQGYTKITPCFFERYALKSEVRTLAKLVSVAIEDFGQGMDGGVNIHEDKDFLTELHEALKAIPNIPAEFRNRPKPKPKAEPATANA